MKINLYFFTIEIFLRVRAYGYLGFGVYFSKQPESRQWELLWFSSSTGHFRFDLFNEQFSHVQITE
jgi:hypothetical protein